MTNYIVLVKQVPDVSQVTDNAFNPETGTLIRGRLQNVINELDTQALAFAHRMKKLSGQPDAKIICLSMGPPSAEEVLRYGLSRTADAAVLLTDRALGGADTPATANPLAFAIRRISSELFGGSNDYFIIAGMQSVDGDTAQVPPQLAEELGTGCISYVTEVEYGNGGFEFMRIVSGGSQRVRSRKLPAVLTVAKYDFPLFASFSATRRAAATPVTTWGASDVNATQIGLKGSRTQVMKVFPPGKTNRHCTEIKDLDELARLMLKGYRDAANASGSRSDSAQPYVLPGRRTENFDRHFEMMEKDAEAFSLLSNQMARLGVTDLYDVDDEVKAKLLNEIGPNIGPKPLDEMLEALKLFEPSYHGEVFVMAEHSQGKLMPATLELTGKAVELSQSLETKVGVVLAGEDVESFVPELFAGGADKVYLAQHHLLKDFDPLTYRKVVSEIVGNHWPQIMLFAATPLGRVLAPMVAYRLGCGLTADCTSLSIRDNSRKGQVGILLQTRPALGGNIMATIYTKDSRCQMATARPGVMKRLPSDLSRIGEVVHCPVSLSDDDRCVDIIETELAQSGTVHLESEIIVSGGKGLQNRDNYEDLLDGLCGALHRKLPAKIEKGASRAAVEQGYTERARQVGQTGTSIGPKLYIALGISGAIQHMIGVSKSEIIVAINNDHNAPIFKQCDYYHVGDVEKVIPELVKALEGAQI